VINNHFGRHTDFYRTSTAQLQKEVLA